MFVTVQDKKDAACWVLGQAADEASKRAALLFIEAPTRERLAKDVLQGMLIAAAVSGVFGLLMLADMTYFQPIHSVEEVWWRISLWMIMVVLNAASVLVLNFKDYRKLAEYQKLVTSGRFYRIDSGMLAALIESGGGDSLALRELLQKYPEEVDVFLQESYLNTCLTERGHAGKRLVKTEAKAFLKSLIERRKGELDLLLTDMNLEDLTP